MLARYMLWLCGCPSAHLSFRHKSAFCQNG